MNSKVLEHLESFNKELNYNDFWDNVDDDISIDDEENFYKSVMIGVWKASPKLRFRELNVDDEYNHIKNDDFPKMEFFQTYAVMYIIKGWLQYKQIYKFDLDTLETVYNSECNDLSYKELKALKMPYNCFAIENNIKYRDKIINSLFISKLADEKLIYCIYGFIENSDQMLRLDLPLEEGQSLYDFLKENVQDDCQELIKRVFNLIKYLCQPKVDILKQRNERKNEKPNKKIKHFYNVSYEENTVGVKLGNAIRNYKYIYEKREKDINTERKKRIVKPHMRCGHFQGYWTGKGRTILTTKYIEPTFVLGGSKEATLHEVKK